MLVYGCFTGDDTGLALRQHDRYGRALGLIIDGCRRHYVNACHIVGIAPDRWPADLRVDHRTLQDAHDLTAAAWRWRSSLPQRRLALEPNRAPALDMEGWLDWLAEEVRAWRDDPGLVLSVFAIVTHQNDSIGYAGELRLRRDLLLRYVDVPWREGMLADGRGDA